MVSQQYVGLNIPLSPLSVRNEKQPYHHEELELEDSMSKASVTDKRMKYKIRRLRLIQRSLNLAVCIAILSIMINTYVTFATHRTIHSNGQTIPIYPTDPITWPTFMMMATGAVSILFNGAIMSAYFWGIAASNRVSAWSSYWGYFMHVVNICVWLVTSITFQMSKGAPDSVPPPNDLYGWTCSDRTDQLSAEFALPVDFNLQCQTQQVSFAMGIINVGLEILAISINIFTIWRMMHKKRIELMRQRDNNYEQIAG